MRLIIDSWLLAVVALAGWINREQDKALEYLLAENRVLKEQLNCRKGRLRFTHAQRCLLGVKAKELGRAALRKIDTLVTPDTLLRWHRELVARKYDGSAKRRPGRPGIMRKIEDLILQMARANPSWGYLRITGALKNVGHVVARTTVANVLARNGIDPASGRKSTWRQFLRSHWDVLAATDFFTVEVWSIVGLVRYHVLFVMEVATRRIEIAGIVCDPYGAWMEQVARNLTDGFEGFLLGKRFLIHDRDPLFTKAFRDILLSAGVKSVRLPPRSPNLNPHAERFVLSIKSECLSHLILLNVGQLRRAVKSYCEHYHLERNHQGLGNRLIEAPGLAANTDGSIECHARLGGLLRYYHRKAA